MMPRLAFKVLRGSWGKAPGSRRAPLWTAIAVALGAGASAVLACGAGDFDPQSTVNSVRIFGVRPDKPYAKPGETVTLEVLATDARPNKPRPMTIYWIPVVCTNPPDDLYYLCFGAALPGADSGARLQAPFPSDAGAASSATAGATAAGASGNDLSRIPTGIDLGPLLPQGPTFSFQMPPDAIQPRAGSPPYGLAIVFNIACAGQVRLAQRSGDNPQQVPIQCTDEQGNLLTPSDYVIGINRVYSYADRTNTDPVVEKVTLDGLDVDPKVGIVVDHCVADKRANCPARKIDVKVSDSSWEPNPSEGDDGLHEQIWATYYSDIGDLQDAARLLFDTRADRVTDSDDQYRAPYTPGDGTLWVVVHDNRAGAAFVVLPIHVK
jgi:hypothetical protein